MSSEILISVRPLETRVAHVENGVLTDLKIERKAAPTLVGSIHRGKVLRVLPGMQAAFVDIGLERSAFLYVGDIFVPQRQSKTLVFQDDDETSEEVVIETNSETESEEERPQIQDLLSVGQMILVQVAKDPIGNKGARLTTHVSLPGRYLVLLPTLKHIGISRRIEDEETRERLKQFVEKTEMSGGAIVRTACAEASEEDMRSDLEYLERLWREISKNYEKRKTAGLVHSEIDIEMRTLRDLLNDNVSSVYIDDETIYKKVSRFVSQFIPKFRNSIKLYEKETPLFDMYDIELEVSRALDRRVWLKSGGYIVIDEAEALVVIDVNTGRYVGKRDLEDTIVKTNLESAREICNQIKIRNVGGIIIIDFIDMEKAVHREMLLNVLEEELSRDRARTKIVSMSEIGLVEMTRKRIRPSLSKILCEPCSYCDGKGYIKRKSTIAGEIMRQLEREALFIREGQKPIVQCHEEIVDWIYEVEQSALERIENKLATSLVFKTVPGFHIEQFEISVV